MDTILLMAHAMILVAMGLGVAHLNLGKSALFQASKIVAALAAALNLVWMMAFAAEVEYCVLLDPWGVASMFMFLILAVSLAATQYYRAPRLLLGSLALAASAAVLGRALLPQVGVEKLPMSWLLAFHIFLMLTGIAGMSIGFVVSLLILLRSKKLKSQTWAREADGVGSPSLSVLDRIFVRSLIAGVFLFCLGVVLGIMTATGTSLKIPWYTDTKVLLSLGGLALYAVVGFLRKRKGFVSRSVAGLAAVGFILMLFSLFASEIFERGFHKF